MPHDYYSEAQGNIVTQKFLRSTDEAVDLWAKELAQLIEATPHNGCFFVLVDVAGPNVGFTARARERSKELFLKYRHRQGYIAFLFEWRTSPYFARLFFASLGKLDFKLNYFHKRDQALAWLETMQSG